MKGCVMTDKRLNKLTIRFSDKEYDAIQEAACLLKLDKSDYVRQMLFNDGISEADRNPLLDQS